MELRPYQLQAEKDVYAAWATGAQNVLLQMHTGAGKTVLFSKFIADSDVPAIAIAHRVELVSQISLTLARYGIRHNIIAQKAAVRAVVAIHMSDVGRSFYDPQARHVVAGVDTLLRLEPSRNPWFKRIGLVVQDEGHHPLKENKWGKAAALFPTARGLYPTATPLRADGCGLGRHADGLIDAMVTGPSMRQLIDDGFLTDYHIVCPPSNLDLSAVPLGSTGDYNQPRLRSAVHKSCITGDVVKHYLKFAAGKLGVTFAVDVESATEIAANFRAAGVAAEVISGKTPDLLRHQIMQRFRRRELLQLVNVDLLGEGVDVPAIEVVSMARPTQSYSLFMQQSGRALRPLEGKKYALIIDHVDNIKRHGLPDTPRSWSLDRRERRTSTTADGPPIKRCLNEACFSVYERFLRACPFCGHHTPPQTRSAPEFVDGDLIELDADALAALRAAIARVDNAPRIPIGLDSIARRGIMNRHHARQQAQHELREHIALWAGHHKARGRDDSEIYRRFYVSFGIDVATAQTLGANDAGALQNRIETDLNLLN